MAKQIELDRGYKARAAEAGVFEVICDEITQGDAVERVTGQPDYEELSFQHENPYKLIADHVARAPEAKAFIVKLKGVCRQRELDDRGMGSSDDLNVYLVAQRRSTTAPAKPVPMMRAALWMGPEEIEFKRIARPTAGPGQVLIKVAYAGICGTDLMIYLGRHPRAKAPLVMSHEFSGTVAEDPAGAWRAGTNVVINPLLSCGECYACRNGLGYICEKLGLVGIDADGGFAEYVVVPAHTVRAIPANLTLQRAALVEPLAVAVHAVSVSDLRVGDTVAVLGAGPVGILTAQVARLAGALQVFVSEVSPRRLSIARELGFSVIDARQADPVEQVMNATGGAGVPVVYESAGSQTTVVQAGLMARIGGQILQIGMPKGPVTMDLTPLLFREIRRRPIRVYREQDVLQAIAIAATNRIDLDRPVTHILPIEELGRAMELSHAATDACKVLLTPAI